MNGTSVLNSAFDPTLPCPRCQGFRISEGYHDHYDSCEPTWVFSLRCINCGSVEDPTIHQNHRLVRLPPPRRQLPGGTIGVKPVLRRHSGKPRKRRRA